MEKKKPDMQFWKARLNKDSRLHTHTHKETLLFMLLLACVPGFFLTGPYIAEELAPHILHTGPLIVQGKRCKGKKTKNRRRDKVVKKRAKTTGRHPDSWGLRWSLCLAFRCLSRLRFGGRCGYQRSRQRETRSPGSRKRRREGGYREREKMRKCYKNLIRRSSTEVTFCVLQPFFFQSIAPENRTDWFFFFFTGPN